MGVLKWTLCQGQVLERPPKSLTMKSQAVYKDELREQKKNPPVLASRMRIVRRRTIWDPFFLKSQKLTSRPKDKKKLGQRVALWRGLVAPFYRPK